MIVRKLNVPLPITAAEKFDEAAYFYNLMLVDRQKTRVVPFLFSAFLTALKSTVDFLLKQHNGHPKFREWFEEQMARKADDPIMSSFYGLRNTSVHHKPIDSTSFDSGPKTGFDSIESTALEFENWTN